jgi:radical SAM superfamily enzyme YgiQ (UPF0313 family)
MVSKKGQLKIYLGDITYDTIILVSDTIPLNIGFVGSYLKKNFGDKIDITLFKYPNEIIEAIKSSPPDIIGLSNYSWNSNLSEFIASVAKKYNPNVVTVQGGTNFPYDDESQKEWLLKKPATDIYTMLEGEQSCANIVQRVLDSNKDRQQIFNKEIDGCIFIKPETRFSSVQKILKGKILDRIKDLNEIPSPYLNGMFDKFFDGKLTPFIETNRGCPFTCSFCHTGNGYHNKINKFTENRVKHEIDYIGKRAQKIGITNLHLADVNFGMYETDRQTAKFLVKSKEECSWPLMVMGTTGKNRKELVIDITNILGDMFAVNMATQSMDEQVLKNIKRKNIKIEAMIDINESLRKEGRATAGELIIPLPGESKESFVRGLNAMLNSNVSSVTIYTLMMLYGTEFKDPSYREEFGYKSKFRIVPLNFGEYEGKKLFDYEEVGIESNTLSFNDYLDLRGLALLVESLHNDRPYDEFFRYAKLFDIQPGTMLKFLYDNISKASENINQIMNGFLEETKGELWDSEQDLLDYYQDDKNYEKLTKGEVGGNLIYKYKSKNIIEAGLEWADFFEEQLLKLIPETEKSPASLARIKSEISEIAIFCKLKVDGLLDINADMKPIKKNFQYDILQWVDNGASKRLDEYKLSKPLMDIYFEYTDDQVKIRDDLFKRYGTDINALSKIVTRVSSLETQFRKVRYNDESNLRDIYKKIGEKFTRYAMSG